MVMVYGCFKPILTPFLTPYLQEYIEEDLSWTQILAAESLILLGMSLYKSRH